jgi:hypothetical protein
MLRMLTFYFVIYVDFLSNRQPFHNKRHNLLIIKIYKKPYKLVKYQFPSK